MQSVSSRIWTRVTVSISYDDINYTTGTSNADLNNVSFWFILTFLIVQIDFPCLVGELQVTQLE